MIITLRKAALSIFFLLTPSNTYPIQHVSWDTIYTKHNLLWLAAGITSALIIGKVSHRLYQAYTTPYEPFIENCRTFYGTLHRNIQACHSVHYNNAQVSDWELKEAILQQHTDPYPFIAYHGLLTKSSWMLKKHLTNLDKQLKKINFHKNQLARGSATESTAHLEELLMQLEIKGKFLQNYIIKTITLVTILKNRVKLFREYDDDCYNWSQQEKTLPNAFTKFC